MSQDVLNSIQSAWANSTKKNLKHQKSVYIRFCDRMGFKELPVSVYKLSLFIQELANQNFKVTTIKNYVSGVKLFQVLSGYSASVFGSELIRLLFKGLSRIQLRGPNQVAPITPKILLQIHACLDLTQQSDITFWSFLVLSFLLMARKSNLVPVSVAGFDAKKQLTWQDVKFPSLIHGVWYMNSCWFQLAMHSGVTWTVTFPTFPKAIDNSNDIFLPMGLCKETVKESIFFRLAVQWDTSIVNYRRVANTRYLCHIMFLAPTLVYTQPCISEMSAR